VFTGEACQPRNIVGPPIAIMQSKSGDDPMKFLARSFLPVLFVSLLLGSVPTSLRSQIKSLKPDALVRQSDVVVVGKVGALASQWNNNRTRIETRVTVSVEQTLKGTAPGSSMTLVIPGGEVDGVGEWYSHSVRFDRDEDVVLFAQREKGDHYRVVNGPEGKISVTRDPRTGAKTIASGGSLESFATRIQGIAKAQSAGPNHK